MKVLLINGSPRKDGNTAIALNEMIKVFEKEGIETEIIHIGHKDIRGCIACGKCRQLGKCVFDDIVAEAGEKLAQADGLVVGSPVYYASANGTVTSFMDRLFYSNRGDLRMKVGASVAVARRGGQTTTFDQLNKYFTISGMPVASGQYWNSVHGGAPGEAAQDLEGLQTMRTLGQNMAWMLKNMENGAEHPEYEKRLRTDFIRR